VLNHISVVSGCICVLQRWDDARKKFVEKLRALGVPVLVLVIVPPGEKNRTPGRCATSRKFSRFGNWKNRGGTGEA
jgi:hypothetical protein